MQITWQNKIYEQGKRIPKEELKAGMIIICGDSEHEASSCWRVEGILAPFVLVPCEGNIVVKGLKKIPVGKTDYSDDLCYCNDLDHLYKAIEITNNKQTIMSTIKTTLKNLILSAQEKVLRKNNLEDEHGEMTQESRDLMSEEMQEERWATRRDTIAKQLIEKEESEK